MKRSIVVAVGLAIVLGFSSISHAENEGQATLDKAAEKNTDIKTMQDLAEVIKLTEQAMKEGLDEGNTTFAKNLLTSVLAQRGTKIGEMAIKRLEAGGLRREQWAQIRDMAMVDLDRVVTMDEKIAEVQFIIARLQALPGGDREKARKAVEKAIELAADNASLKAKALVVRGTEIETDAKKQIADLDEAVKLNAKDPELVRTRGMFQLAKRKDPKAAIADFAKALELAPDHAKTLMAKCVAELAAKQPDEALETINKAIDLEPENFLYLLHRARAYGMMKKYDEAVNDLNLILKPNPKFSAGLLMRARNYQLQDKTDEAKADLEAVMSDEEDRNRIAALVLSMGDNDSAVNDMIELVKLKPDDADLITQLGVLYAVTKKPMKSIETFTEALTKKPDDAKILSHRADRYLGIGKHAEAISDYEAIMKLNVADKLLLSQVLNNYAWVLATSPEEKVRDGKLSVDLGKQACDITKYKAPHILSTLAAGYAEIGDWENAVKFSTQAIEIGKDHEQKEHLEKELASYKEKKPWREATDEEEKDAVENEKKDAAKKERK